MNVSNAILPRKQVNLKDITDLSDQFIQKNREKSCLVKSGNRTKQVLIHECVNFFLNPLNKTFFAFRRNALIRFASKNPLASIVGILELDLTRILGYEKVFWSVSNRNYASYSQREMNYTNFPWQNIYSIHYEKDNNDLHRSAEFIIYQNGNDPTKSIPFKYVNRILVLKQDKYMIESGIIKELNVVSIPNDKKVYVFRDPTSYDFKFAKDVKSIINAGQSVSVFSRPLHRLTKIEKEIELSLLENFINPQSALDYMHGIGHVIRVMFWILVLAEISTQSGLIISEEEKTAAIYSGFFHDLRRKNDFEDSKHGEASSMFFNDLIHSKLKKPYSTRCLNAILVHSIVKDPEDNDVIWKLLKDADALDRGRFGPPDKKNGCNSKYFRLPILKNDSNLSSNLLWAAYFLPRMCAHINWNNQAGTEFVNTFMASQRYVVQTYSVKNNFISIKRIMENYTLLNS